MKNNHIKTAMDAMRNLTIASEAIAKHLNEESNGLTDEQRAEVQSKLNGVASLAGNIKNFNSVDEVIAFAKKHNL